MSVARTLHTVGWLDSKDALTAALRGDDNTVVLALSERIREQLEDWKISPLVLLAIPDDWPAINDRALQRFASLPAPLLDRWGNFLVHESNAEHALADGFERVLDAVKPDHIIFWFRSAMVDNAALYSILPAVATARQIPYEVCR